MDRKNRILNHLFFLEYYEKIRGYEKDRVFCRHDMAHFLDVARLAMILNLQEQIGADGELIYAAALLHDIGRFKQYEDGTPHEKASAALAGPILRDCGYTEKETDVILNAILQHRNGDVKEQKDLTGLIYRADKLSRGCFFCQAEPECNWKNEKKNRELLY